MALRTTLPNLYLSRAAFLEDVRSLLVGPAWLLGFVYIRLGIVY